MPVVIHLREYLQAVNRAAFAGLLKPGTVIPVVVIDNPAAAVPLGRALLAGGIGAMEITLRTPAALEAAQRVASELPEIMLGIGTVTRPAQAAQAADAGARFLVSPGLSEALAAAVAGSGLPFLPGAATVSEILQARELGFDLLKFFPAAQAGGLKMLGYFDSLFDDVAFCPTGGVDAGNAADYLALRNVDYVGGSWLAPARLIDAADWAGITSLARAAAGA